MAEIAAQPFPYAFPKHKTALIVIDMQRDFAEPGGFGESLGNDVSLLRAIVPTVAKLIQGFRDEGLMVIHTQECHRPDLSDLPASKRDRGNPSLRIGDMGPMGRILDRRRASAHAIIAECTPIAGEVVIEKPGRRSLRATRLGAILREGGRHASGFCRRHHRGLRADHDARGQ